MRSLAISLFSVKIQVSCIQMVKNKSLKITEGYGEIFIKASCTPVLPYVSVKDRIDCSSYKITNVIDVRNEKWHSGPY